MFFMRIGIGEIILCGLLIIALIVIPAVLYWKTQRMKDGR